MEWSRVEPMRNSDCDLVDMTSRPMTKDYSLSIYANVHVTSGPNSGLVLHLVPDHEKKSQCSEYPE